MSFIFSVLCYRHTMLVLVYVSIVIKLISAHKRAKRAFEALMANACIKKKVTRYILMLFSRDANLFKRDLIVTDLVPLVYR